MPTVPIRHISGTTAAGSRSSLGGADMHARLSLPITLLVNTLALRGDLSRGPSGRDPTFEELLAREELIVPVRD